MSGLSNGTAFGHAVDRIWSPSGELLEIIQTPLNASALGNTSLISAVANKRIYVLGLFLVTGGATTVEFRDGPTTLISGTMSFGANQNMVLPCSNTPWFNTSINTALTIQLGSAVSVAGALKYVVF